jgi:hypothetical protein
MAARAVTIVWYAFNGVPAKRELISMGSLSTVKILKNQFSIGIVSGACIYFVVIYTD